MFSDALLKAVSEFADLRVTAVDDLSEDEALATLAQCDAALTGWHSPRLTVELLAAAPRFRFVSHIGASIRRLLPEEAVANGRLIVSHAAVPIAEAVAEFTLAQILEHLKQTRAQDRALKEGGDWDAEREVFVGGLLGAQTVGLVGAGYIGRLVIGLLRSFGAEVLVYDPYLDDARAEALGVRRVALGELMEAASIVSLHAPVLPETRHMIDAGMIARMRDGALLINTARSWIIDEAALIEALRTRPIFAAIDVFDQEPLPFDSPFRRLANVALSPHTAGHTWETYARQGRVAVDELRRFLAGEPLRHQVTPAMLATMA